MILSALLEQTWSKHPVLRTFSSFFVGLSQNESLDVATSNKKIV